MSSTIACPHCQAPIPHMPDLAGRKITCGNCKGGFEMPASPGDAPTPLNAAPAPAPPTPPPPAPVAPAPSIELEEPIVEADVAPEATAQPLPTAMQVATPIQSGAPTTPMGVSSGPSSYRRTVKQRFEPSDSIFDLFDWKFQKYVTPLIIRLTWKIVVVMFLFALVYYLVGPEEWDKWSEANTSSSGAPETEFRVPIWMIMVFQRIVMAVTMILTLLWIRVVLESMIVIFNIAGSVTEIEKNTSGRID